MRAAPIATYRVQLGPDLDLFAAADLADHLADLGVSHVYCSPFLQAAPDSPHGYAVVDHHRVDERLGGEEGRLRLIDAASVAGMGVVIDLVPNHMAVSLPANRWFWEVLEHGPSSRYARYFDIDWDPPESTNRNKVLLPILGDHYGREVESGAVRFEHDHGEFTVRYHDNVLPASPRSVGHLLEEAAARSDSDELRFVARSLASLPPASATDEALRSRRHGDAAYVAQLLADLTTRPDLRKTIDDVVADANDDPDSVDRLLDVQNYRLARWQVADQELGYRRFFDIDDLIGLRVEDPTVFSDSHDLVLQWVATGEVAGLRIDHPDGLRRPTQYLDRLRHVAPDAWIVVEKILEGGEELPAEWPVDGTTGYEFLTDVTALLVDPSAEQSMTDLWAEVSGSDAAWPEVAEQSKRDVLTDVLAADLNRLTDVFVGLVGERRRYRDFTRAELADALTEALIAFDVYRTYVGEREEAGVVDRARITAAIHRARRGAPAVDGELFDLLSRILSGDLTGPHETELRMRFQQLTGPVMAKGVEDTAFYRYLRLAALCDVGGDPGRFGLSDVGVFHRRCAVTQERWPATMLSLSTHDTKRSEDVRARLAVLSEIPRRWREAVSRWMAHNDRHRPGRLDGATEYLIYQTLVGAYPIGLDRLLPYLEKATKEAKLHTSWTAPDETYDEAVATFARRLDGDAGFQADLAAFVAPVITTGRINSLIQKTLQLTAPGVPDIYQGSELWDLSLVDPDNRRPVDHWRRRRLMSEIEGIDAATAVSRMEEGVPKLWLIRTLLDLRHRRGEAFGPRGGYRPLPVRGTAAEHVVAYSRGEDVTVVVPRLTRRLRRGGAGSDTTVELSPGRWADVFSGRIHEGEARMGALLADFPVAVLERG